MKTSKLTLIALLILSLLALTLAACDNGGTNQTQDGGTSTDTGTGPDTGQGSDTGSGESTESTPPAEPGLENTFFVGASWNGYLPDDAGSILKKLEGFDNVYYIEVNLTEDNADPVWGGHFYKVTNGTWDADGCWGADFNIVKTIPVHPDGAGLGSIWIDRNGVFTIYFNSDTKQLFDTSSVPRIYGDFNTAMNRGYDWDLENDSLLLLDLNFNGVFEGTFTIPGYEGEGEGYMMAVCITIVPYEWGGVVSWGAGDQYLFDGTPGGMGLVSFFKPDRDVIVTFSYDPATNVTTLTQQDA